ncbi:hypothetical protein DPMN_027046, partial [Dreissena polymorpha]
MPTQEIGAADDQKVKVITVDSVTGAFLSASVHHSDTSSTGDSVDGSLSLFNNFQNDDVTLVSEQVEGNGVVTTMLSGVNNSMVSGSDSVISVTPQQFHDLKSSVNSVSSPQVIIVDANDRTSLLGKRPSTGVISQTSLANKIIITKHHNPSQALVGTQGASGQSTGADATSPQTPTKTITISQPGVSPMKVVTVTQVPGRTPPKIPIHRVQMPMARTPTKITMIPRSPQRIAPASVGHAVISNTNNSTGTITLSPSKVIHQQGTVHVIQKQIQPSLGGATVMTLPRQPNATPIVRQGVSQIHVPGNKFQYIRLVNPSNSNSISQAQLVAVTAAGVQAQPMKITMQAQPITQLVNTRPVGTTSVQRIILPATQSQVSIRPAPVINPSPGGPHIIRTTLTATNQGSLQHVAGAGGPTFLTSGAAGTQGVQGFALVPASYLTQIQQQIQVKPTTVSTKAVSVPNPNTAPQTQLRAEYLPIASNNLAISASTKNANGTSVDASGAARPRKPCNCTKSQCLKLYCDCFANGEFCHNCNCNNCANNLEHEEDRSRAIKSCLERNPSAFHPKIGKGRAGERDRRHNKGCNCKRSGCLKNYCECYEAKIMCSSSCKCVGCKNFEESPERKTLMHLADAAEVRVQQQTAAKSKLSSQISDLPSRPANSSTGERLPFSFVTTDVVEATCACLLAQAEEGERQRMPGVVQERMVIEEFGRCLVQIIESANRTK